MAMFLTAKRTITWNAVQAYLSCAARLLTSIAVFWGTKNALE
jgi:hypothetical protein